MGMIALDARPWHGKEQIKKDFPFRKNLFSECSFSAVEDILNLQVFNMPGIVEQFKPRGDQFAGLMRKIDDGDAGVVQPHAVAQEKEGQIEQPAE